MNLASLTLGSITFLVVFGLGRSVGSAAGTQLRIPEIKALRSDAASASFSVLRRDLRLTLFRQIEVMSAEHLRLLSNISVQVKTEANASSWAAKRVAVTGIPSPDCAIVAGILLQIDILDAALNVRDPSRAQALRSARGRRPLQNNEERIFHDGRDHVFLVCVDGFEAIAALQSALGGGKLEPLPPPARAKSRKEAEAQLTDGLSQLARRARQIP